MNRQNDICLMLTSSGGTLSPAIIQYLKQQPHLSLRIVTADTNEDVKAKLLSAGHHVVPNGDHPDYPEVIADIVRRENVDVVLPWSDEEAMALSPVRDRELDIGAKVIVSQPSCMNRIGDKLASYQALESKGIKTPEYSVARTLDEIREAAAQYGFPRNPVVTKPTKGRGGRGMFLLCGDTSPAAWIGSGAREVRLQGGPNEIEFDRLPDCEMLVMPVLDEPVYDIDVLARAGVVKAVVPRKRGNPTGIPYEGNTIVASQSLIEYGAAVAAALELDSLHDIDIMSGSDGEPRLLEVNPRPSGSLLSSLVAGFPLLEAAIAQAIGFEIEVRQPTQNIEVIQASTAIACHP